MEVLPYDVSAVSRTPYARTAGDIAFVYLPLLATVSLVHTPISFATSEFNVDSGSAANAPPTSSNTFRSIRRRSRHGMPLQDGVVSSIMRSMRCSRSHCSIAI